MSLEPVNLKAPLTAVFDGIRLGALWTCVKRYELLIEFFAVSIWIIDTVLLIFPDVLKWTLIIFTLANVDQFIVRWFRVDWDALHC